MNNLLSLLKVQFASFLGLNKILHAPKGKKISGVGGLILTACAFAFGAGYIGFSYAEMFALPFLSTGNVIDVLPLMTSLSCIVSFFLSFYTVIALLFGNKDYEFLSSLPIKTNDIVFSRIIFICLQDFAFTFVIMVGSLIKYLQIAPALAVEQYLYLVIMMVVSPLLPVAISVVLGVITYLISSRFKKKNTVQTFIMLIMVFGFMALGFSGFDMTSFSYATMVSRIYFIYPIALKSITEWQSLLIYCLINVLSFVGVATLTAFGYKWLNTIGKTNKKSKAFKLSSYGGRSQLNALFVREVKRAFSDVNYLINMIFGPILGLAGLIAFPIVLKSMGMGYAEELIFIYPLILTFTFSLTPSTNCSLSLEGHSFWIIRTSPISIKRLLNVKLATNAVFFVVSAFVGSLVSTIILGAPYYVVLLITGFGLAVSCLGGEVGLMMNLLFPHMDWKSTVEVVKRSVSVFLTMLFSMSYTGLCFIFLNFVEIPIVIGIAILFAVTTILAVVLYALIMKYGEKLIALKI